MSKDAFDFDKQDIEKIIKLFLEKDGLEKIKDTFGEDTLKDDEVKRAINTARFHKYFPNRVDSVLSSIKNLERMANTYNYFFERSEVRKSLSQINKAVRSLENSFREALDKLENDESKNNSLVSEEQKIEETFKKTMDNLNYFYTKSENPKHKVWQESSKKNKNSDEF
jgi:Zn-dependent M32 family carboxypeptidase